MPTPPDNDSNAPQDGHTPGRKPDISSDDAQWTVVDEHEAGPQFGPGFGTPWGVPRPKPRATLRFMLSNPAHIISLGFGSGLSRIMPGTCGTVMGWILFALLYPHLSYTAWAVLIIGGFFAGIWLCGLTAKRMNTPDPGAVVWDEIIAIWIVLLYMMPTGFAGQLGGFLVFRFFDMVKPPPIRYFDRRLKGGFGIMFDDIVAAVFAIAVIAVWRS